MSSPKIKGGVISGATGNLYVGEVMFVSKESEEAFNYDQTDMYQIELDDPRSENGMVAKKALVSAINSDLLLP